MACKKRQASTNDDERRKPNESPKSSTSDAPTPSISPAYQAVFQTTELLENILVNLGIKTLLLAQRVDRHWCDVISTNKKLQQKLFMRPATLTEAIELHLLNINDTGKQRSPRIAIRKEPVGKSTFHVVNTLLFGGGHLRGTLLPNVQAGLQTSSWAKMYTALPTNAEVDTPLANLQPGRKWSEDVVHVAMDETDTVGEFIESMEQEFNVEWPTRVQGASQEVLLELRTQPRLLKTVAGNMARYGLPEEVRKRLGSGEEEQHNSPIM